ncbi:sulfotransferase [soil metagenome]
MKKFIHIGFPKNFSTSLQRDFFAAHKDIFHLGIGPGIDYADPVIDAAFEVYLKTAKKFKYNENEKRLSDHFNRVFETATASGKKVLTASSEHLSFSFANDSIDFEEKMHRVSKLFGSDTHIIMIIRNQADLIKSLYRESVRVGFPGTYQDYIYLLYKYQDRNFYYDFRYDLVLEVLQRYFKAENIHLLLFEDFKPTGAGLTEENGKTKLIVSLCAVLGIDYPETPLNHSNEALSDGVVKVKSELNKTTRHDLGNILYDTAEKHRMKHYLQNDLGLAEENDTLYSDVILKRQLIKDAETSNTFPTDYKIDFTLPESLALPIRKFYEQGNNKLNAISAVQLPAQYFNLKF